MDAADSAGGKDTDPGTICDPTGGSDGGGAVPFLTYGDRQVANTHLFDLVVFGDEANLFVAEPDRELPVEYRDGGRDGISFANDLFETLSGGEILWTRQTVRSNG